MMYGAPRKLLFSQFSLHETTRILLENDSDTCSCALCPGCVSSPNIEHYLSPPPPPPSIKNNMPMLFIVMLCTLGVAFVSFCTLTILKKYRSNLSNSRRRSASFANGIHDNFVDENQEPVLDHPIWYIRTVGLQQSVIDSIAVFKYKKDEGLVEGTDCSVCLSEFQEDESLRLLPKCSHAFHITCIDTWLRSHKNCPLCRAPIVNYVNNSTTTDTTLVNTGQSVLDSREDATIVDQQENGEDGEVGGSVSRMEGENVGPLRNEQGKILERNNRIRVLSDLVDHRVRVEEELQSARRSFSMDLSSASKIYDAGADSRPVQEEGCSTLQEVEVKKQNLDKVAAKIGNKNSSITGSRNSFSFGRSLQSVPIRMKRSLSSSGNLSFHKNSRSQ